MDTIKTGDEWLPGEGGRDLLQKGTRELYRVVGVLCSLIVGMVTQLQTLDKTHMCVQSIEYK
jgi:hypothetical protein